MLVVIFVPPDFSDSTVSSQILSVISSNLSLVFNSTSSPLTEDAVTSAAVLT